MATTKFSPILNLTESFISATSLRRVLSISISSLLLGGCFSPSAVTDKSGTQSAGTPYPGAQASSTYYTGAQTKIFPPQALLPGAGQTDALPPPPSLSTAPQYSDWLFDGPEGRGFAYYLAQGYRRYAKHEDNAHDFEDAAKFLFRAGAVERGERIEPELLSMRILPFWALDDLVYARQRLMRALNFGAAERLPKIAANAQVAFDCWMEQQEENIQPHDVARCRKDFEGFIVRLEGLPIKRPAPLMVGTPGAECGAAQPLPAACSENRSYVLGFDLDRHNINAASQEVALQIANMMRSTPVGYLELTAHADRSGSDEYNERLSRQRLESALAALRNQGVAAERITLARHYGETRPRIKTVDGVREAANRRVEARLVCTSPLPENNNESSPPGVCGTSAKNQRLIDKSK